MKVTLLVLCLVTTALASALAAATAQESKGPAAVGARAERVSPVSGKVRELLSAAGVEVPEGLPASAAHAASHREVVVSWETGKPSASPASADRGELTQGLLRAAAGAAPVRREGGLPKQRSAELSVNQLLVAAVDSGNRLRWWGLIDDPRLVRAESPGPDGVLTGQLLYMGSAEFSVAFPEDEAITELRLYQPDWDGHSFSLRLLGSVAAAPAKE